MLRIQSSLFFVSFIVFRSTVHRRLLLLEIGDWSQEALQSEAVAQTVMHYNMRKQGFVEETKWSSSSQNKGSKSDIDSIGHGFRKFQSPTIFLKIACDGDAVLPIIVGMYKWHFLSNGFDKS
ncbi:hypothetical protein QJS10_CPA06g00671 [Acorus calamus]|uniref:Uncharacterized protein n=1 Tax=Acorus calamus TaxID=4465 RepID=A0AAV9EKN0_ACOCL|nr:hypothetical protein QJS10_CPA06g00671 [Acorus calamus]